MHAFFYIMMELIDHTVHEDPQPKLVKENVISLLPKKSTQKQTRVQKDIQSILNSFQEDKKIDIIIGNASLSGFLRSIASNTTTDGLKKVNQNIITNVKPIS